MSDDALIEFNGSNGVDYGKVNKGSRINIDYAEACFFLGDAS